MKPILVRAKKSLDSHPKYGRILRVEYPDGCKFYVTKKGLILTVPKTGKLWKDNIKRRRKPFEMLITMQELDVLLQALEWYELQGGRE